MAFDKVAYMKAYHRRDYQENRANIDAKNKEYFAKHRPTILAYKKEWYKSNFSKIQLLGKEKYRAEKQTKRLAYNLKKYSITLDYYRQLEVQQKGFCAICGRLPLNGRRLDVDHCHKTGKVRGLLCSNCNRGIGYFKDDRDLLEKVKVYLKGGSYAK